MSSCQGELPETTFEVSAIDQKGNELFKGPKTTLKNGFFEIWLPRDRNIQLTIQGLGLKTQGQIGTFDQSDTCITTFQLK
ncbi:CueP family metal-binding protein [Desulfatitalea tepidiphila]|uniref:CueP family metal-binding protein n=1 Tax=Desulfatitalea tepidiphila TaxID=1185843 RepID=UPI0006B41466|nr:CueP family metal-binding protein [Desulfatitalea tepidiphila]